MIEKVTWQGFTKGVLVLSGSFQSFCLTPKHMTSMTIKKSKARVQYIQTDTIGQIILTNRTIGNRLLFDKGALRFVPLARNGKLLSQWTGIPFVNCISHLEAVRKRFVDWYHWYKWKSSQPIG